MKRLVHEIHRRSLWQVLGIYLAGSWIALQVVEQLTEAAGLPDWVRPFSLALMVLGFPVVMATAFVQEGMSTRGMAKASTREQPSPAEVDEVEPSTVSPPSPSPAPEPRTHHGLLTWRNALFGGLGAFALLGILTAGYLFMRTAGIGPAGTLVAKGLFDERDRIVLADFGSGPDDAVLAGTVTETMRVDFARSQVVRVADPAFISAALSRMGRGDAGSLDAALARELAQREGIKAVLTGEIAPAGNGYFLTASLLSPETGEILTSERVAAADAGEIIGAIDDLSKRLRERIGESLRTIQTEKPLEQVTTSDLEALRLYTQGLAIVEGNEYRRGLDMLEEAIGRDSMFAMAHRKLGMELFNRGENRSRALEAVSRAYEYRDRLSSRERYLAEAAYFTRVMDDNERSIGAYQNMLELDPEDPWALNNLGVSYSRSGDPAAAEEYYERASAADSTGGIFSFTNTVSAEIRQGKFDEATATLETARRLYPEDWMAARAWTLILWARMEWDESERRLAEVREEWRSPFLRATGAAIASWMTSARGRLEESERESRAVERIDEERGLGGDALQGALGPAWVALEVREDPDRALRLMNEALARHPLADIPAEDRPYVQLARLTARSGRPADSRAWSAELDVEVPEESRAPLERPILLVAADRALAEGRAPEAIDLYRRGKPPGCSMCVYIQLAQAHLLLGRADSAIALLTAFVETPELYRLFGDQTGLGPSYEQLAELHDSRGELDEAVKYYALFVELWKEADEELEPRVRAAQARLEAILKERG